jgi:hypothetical protein
MRPLNLKELSTARELVELRLLTAALNALLTVLRFEHPTLQALAEPTDPPTLRAARRLARHALLLRAACRHYRAACRHYRAAVRRVLADPPADDFPF